MANATLPNSRYVALTTYRRDGRPVTTPVWSAPLAGKLYVVTAESTGKARRLRATGRVRFAACNMNGRRILGDWEEGTGRIVQDEARYREALAALRRKYGWQLSLARLINRLRGVDRDRVVRVPAAGRLAKTLTSWWIETTPSRPPFAPRSFSPPRRSAGRNVRCSYDGSRSCSSGVIQICRKCTGSVVDGLNSLCVTPVPAV